LATEICAAGTFARTRNIELLYSALGSAPEAMKHITRINVESRDRPRWIDALADGALAGAFACATAPHCANRE
jgi:hypothetical protein